MCWHQYYFLPSIKFLLADENKHFSSCLPGFTLQNTSCTVEEFAAEATCCCDLWFFPSLIDYI